ncbi:MAG: hypothetical protein ACR2HH_04020 [Chthoniobacterales bacterium]
MTKLLSLLLTLSLTLTSCSMLTKSGRQQHAYEKYVRRSSVARVKQRSIFHGNKPSMPTSPMPTEPMPTESSGPIPNAESGPQAVPAES